MSRVHGRISVLTRDEMESLHRTAVRILSDIGMRIDHLEALERLADVGAHVDARERIVRFPDTLVEASVTRMRQQFAGPPRYERRVPMRYTSMCFSTMARDVPRHFDVNTGGFPPYILDLDGHRRRATLEDVRDSIRLADALPHIDLVGLPCSAQEVPAALRPVIMTAELVKHTGKLGGIEAWTPADVEYIQRIAVIVRGSEEAQRAQPVLIGYGEAKSPLTLDAGMAEVFLRYVKAGFPQSLDTMPAGGTTAPATSAGTLALGLAETLGALTLAYAVDPDAIISLDICPTLTDMRSTIYPYAGADRLPLVTAAVQMLHDYYGRPGGCHGGKTDACVPGVQAGVEKALSILFPVLAGATGVGTLGHVENALTFSPVQLVIDNEIAGYIRRMIRGFEVNEETLAFEVIKEVGIGGNYLTHPHTAAHFRDEFWLPDLMERLPWETWQQQEIKGFEARAAARARRILAEHHPHPLDREQERAIDEIVSAARADPRYG